MIEIEVKIPVEDRDAAIRKIESRGARLTRPRSFEQNTLYDFRGGDLYRKRHALRLRCVNKKTFLTFKGDPQKSRKFKIREEFETEVKNRDHIGKILKSLGLVPVYRYSKHRTVYRHKRLKICVDETAIGVFLELEGKRSDIVRFAEAIGFDKSTFIKTDYIQLMEEEKARNRA